MPGKEKGGDGPGTVSIETHGCKLNQADSEVLARRFAQAGYVVVGPSEPADIHVVNTCTVTHVADSKARQSLRAAHRSNPSSLVVATGCYAQRAPVELAAVEGVSVVAGNSEKARLVEMVLQTRGDEPEPRAVGDDDLSPRIIGGESGRTRAMVKIQEGCNQVCSYCIVPKVRGRERSIPPDALLGQVRERVKEGYKEVVLTGTQLGTYGFDLEGTDLKSLVELLLWGSGIERLRVSSLQPQEITSDLLELWDDHRLCPHFHMPLQSGCDDVLKRMRRRYNTDQYAQTAERIRARVPGVAITADMIVGFPGEEEGQFQDSLRFVERIGFASIHVFPYSVRPGTSAAYMGPKIDEITKRERVEEMLSVARQQASAFRRRCIGTTRQVLWERTDEREGRPVRLGLTDNYLKTLTPEGATLLNQITLSRLVAEEGDALLAQVV